VNANKAKGSAFERLIADYVGEVVPCERIPAGANVDRGDLWCPLVAIQTKNRRELRIASWLDETLVQQRNAKKDWSFLVVKRAGVAAPGNQLAVCSVAQMRRLIALVHGEGY
jgi:hypothetical protein